MEDNVNITRLFDDTTNNNTTHQNWQISTKFEVGKPSKLVISNKNNSSQCFDIDPNFGSAEDFHGILFKVFDENENISSADELNSNSDNEKNRVTKNTFLLVFNNELYEIKNAVSIGLYGNEFNLFLFTSCDKQPDIIDIHSFSIQDGTYKDITIIRHIGAFDSTAFESCMCKISPNLNYIKLDIFFDTISRYYYINELGKTSIKFINGSHFSIIDTATIIRFNTNKFEKRTIENYKIIDTTHFSDSNIKLPKFIVTKDGIFDVKNFRVINLGRMFKALRIEDFNQVTFNFYNVSGKNILYIFLNNTHHCIETKNINNKEIYYKDTAILYDIDESSFISCSNENPKWSKFLIYDSGIPHIIVNSDPSYTIITLKKDKNSLNKNNLKFVKIKVTEISKIISFVDTIKNHNQIQRILFAHLKNVKQYNDISDIQDAETADMQTTIADSNDISKEDIMLVIDNNLVVTKKENYIKFEVVTNYYTTLKLNDLNSYIVCKDILFNNYKSYILSDSLIIYAHSFITFIAKTLKGDFGQYILIYNCQGKLNINYKNSFCKYEVTKFHITPCISSIFTDIKVYNFLKVTVATSDYDNKIYYLNVTPNTDSNGDLNFDLPTSEDQLPFLFESLNYVTKDISYKGSIPSSYRLE